MSGERERAQAAFDPLPGEAVRRGSGGLVEMLAEAAERDPGRVAIVHGGERVSYADLLDRAGRLAAGLSSLGLGPGDPVALVVGNTPSFVAGFLAIAGIGAVVVPLQPRFREAELGFFFHESGVRAVISDPGAVAACRRIAEAAGDRITLIEAGAGGGARLSVESLTSEHPSLGLARRRADDDCVYQYSSGTTGRPKRVPRTHGQLGYEADAFVAATGLTADDTILCAIPLFHTYGMGCCMAAALRSGATLVLSDEHQPFVLGRRHVLELAERESVTVFPAVPFVFRALADAPETADLASLRLCFSASTALPLSTFEAFADKFGVPIRQLYGCTEAGALTVNTGGDPRSTALSVGRPLDGVEVRILDEAGMPRTDGRIGDVIVSSPAMTHGYAAAEEVNRRAFRDGFFVTGDRGRLDDGRLYLTGRTKLLIDVRGAKVDPIEVEDVLATHPRVAEVVVLGVPGGTEGEELVKAVVVPDGRGEERELVRFCRERLASFKVPSIVEFRDEIPKDSSGKVARGRLVE